MAKRRGAAKRGARGARPKTEPAASEVPLDRLATSVLAASSGAVLAVAGCAPEVIRTALDGIVDTSRRVLFLPFPAAGTASEIIESVIVELAETALRLWPDWFGGEIGPMSRLRMEAAAGPRVHGALQPWVNDAAERARAGRLPRVPKTNAATELSQLAMAINPAGLVLMLHCDVLTADSAEAQAAIHALEWIAEHSQASVVALFTHMPSFAPPFDRILYGALQLGRREDLLAETMVLPPGTEAAPWIAPWRGKPHPLSAVELRLFEALGKDRELADLFTFNTLVETVRGTTPKVDLLWRQGLLVVELDGYESHGKRTAFIGDRQRDYELLLSGYTVLRLVNEEITQDIALALEKIRNVVHLRSQQIARE